MLLFVLVPFLFFFNDTATTEIYTLSLHDALPISQVVVVSAVRIGIAVADERDLRAVRRPRRQSFVEVARRQAAQDRKSTRLNSSHMSISYAVFCLKKKKKTKQNTKAKHRKERRRT